MSSDMVMTIFHNSLFTAELTEVEIFSIKPSSGIIQVIKPIPKSVDSYILNITAKDDGQCCGRTRILSSKMTLTVEVVDAVNQKPRFTNCYSDRFNVTENWKPGKLAFTVSVLCNYELLKILF